MTVTPEQRRAINAAVCVNETGHVPSDSAYSTVAFLNDGAGVSYGFHQSTDRSNSLDLVLKWYIEHGGRDSALLEPYYRRLVANETATADPKNLPQWIIEFMGLLAHAGTDPLMREAQDYVFGEYYFRPAEDKCRSMGLVTALSHLIVYDTCIHSGPGRIDSLRKEFPEHPPATGGSESAWTAAFLKARGLWLGGHSKPEIRKTVYRVNWLQKLVDAEVWDLATPFKYGPVTIS